MILPILYKRSNSKEHINQWQIEVERNKFRTTTGFVNMKMFTGDWTECTPKNIGKKNATTAASAEGNYESDDVFEGEEPRLEPDMLDGQLVENAIRQLPEMSRKVLKARYIQYPYHLKHTVAQKLKMSVDRLEGELLIAKRRLYDRLQRNTSGNRGVAEGSVGLSNSITG